MDLSFNSIVEYVATYFFGGSTTLAGLAMLLGVWIVSVVICINLKAGPAYSVVPMIPAALFFTAYGILDETVALVIILMASVMVAHSMKEVAN